jgi:hypothetical protein
MDAAVSVSPFLVLQHHITAGKGGKEGRSRRNTDHILLSLFRHTPASIYSGLDASLDLQPGLLDC